MVILTLVYTVSPDRNATLKAVVETYAKAIKVLPYDLESILGKIRALLALNDYKEIIECSDNALKQGSKLGSFMTMYHSDEKKGYYYRNQDTKDLYNKLGLLWNFRGKAFENLKKYDEAFESYKKAKEYSDKMLSVR